MNKLEKIVDQSGEEETFTYDSQGRMASHTDRNHVKTTYGYNMDDQLRFKRAEMLEDTSVQAGRNKRSVVGQENQYSYNSLGQLIEASGGGVVYNYTYTPNGNVKDKLVNGSKALSYTYTASGKVAGITDKSGKKTAYQYDKAGRVASVSDNGKLVAEYSYYEDGNLRQVKFANGIYTEYIYNADKNYKNITTKSAEGEILLDYSYAYDGNGNRTKKVGSNVVSKHEGNDSANGVTNYIYDSLQRLQEVSYPTGKVEQFQYDHAGNRALKKYGTAENFKTGNYLEERYQYDNRNRLLERKNPKDVTYYQYDKQGNTVSELT
ncbi:MAG: RHS repeat protein, partial [Lachnospiraceae bacterium]|nr:RHS repeat protein [Lachnospiraceae bacterium]